MLGDWFMHASMKTAAFIAASVINWSLIVARTCRNCCSSRWKAPQAQEVKTQLSPLAVLAALIQIIVKNLKDLMELCQWLFFSTTMRRKSFFFSRSLDHHHCQEGRCTGKTPKIWLHRYMQLSSIQIWYLSINIRLKNTFEMNTIGFTEVRFYVCLCGKLRCLFWRQGISDLLNCLFNFKPLFKTQGIRSLEWWMW